MATHNNHWSAAVTQDAISRKISLPKCMAGAGAFLGTEHQEPKGRLPTSSNNRHRETHAVCFEQSVSKHAHFHRHANLPLSYTKLTDPRLELDLPGRKQPSLQSCLTTIRLTRWIKFLLCKIKAWATKLNQAIHSSLLPQAALKSTVATTMEAHRGGSGNTTTSPIWRPHSSYIYIYMY